MSDISKINPNGTEYNLKDATARAGIESSKTLKSSVVTVNDAAPINAEDITVDITPKQDLHGYDHPWAGGAGKNKCPTNNYSGVGTWLQSMVLEVKGKYVYRSADFTTDSGAYTFNVYGIKDGTSTPLDLSAYYASFSDFRDVSKYDHIQVYGYSNSANNVISNIMICFANNTDDIPFEPYSNICPIEGWTGAELTQKDAATNPTVTHIYTASFGETIHGGKWHVTKGGTDKTYGNIANYNGETINEPWLSSMDEYSPGATPTTGAQVVYPLTTPTTISTPKQNVPMLKGINTVSANCGDTSLKYQPDNVIGELKGDIEDNIIYEDFKWTTNSSQSYSAGTPGTYGTSSWRDVKKEGYDVIGVTFVENRRFGDCILTLYYIPSTSHVEVIIFRATSSAVTIADEDIEYRVAYKKRT